jgi:hypothetical protein
LFDAEIQSTLGLVTLAAWFSWGKVDHPHTEISACPILMAHYIKARCLIKLGRDTGSKMAAVNDFNRHCYSARHKMAAFDNADLVLCAALKSATMNE